MLSKAESSTIFWVFGMTRSEIERRSSEPLEYTLLIRPMAWCTKLKKWLGYILAVADRLGNDISKKIRYFLCWLVNMTSLPNGNSIFNYLHVWMTYDSFKYQTDCFFLLSSHTLSLSLSLSLYIYIYIYIYVCVCVCLFISRLLHLFDDVTCLLFFCSTYF